MSQHPERGESADAFEPPAVAPAVDLSDAAPQAVTSEPAPVSEFLAVSEPVMDDAGAGGAGADEAVTGEAVMGEPVMREAVASEAFVGEAVSPATERSARIDMGQVRDELVAWLKTLVSAAVYAVLIVTFGFQVARVEGRSMAPTLEDQDRLIVNKLVYRIADPRRGDIVMLYYPLDPDKSFVKRVIAEENDTVRIVDGRVYVNDVPLHDDYVPDDYRSHDDWGPQVIPEGYYFVMGDHRNNSSDSRHWGMVPKKYIIGKVQVRWWPVPEARLF